MQLQRFRSNGVPFVANGTLEHVINNTATRKTPRTPNLDMYSVSAQNVFPNGTPERPRTTRQTSLFIAFAHNAPNIAIHSVCAQRAKHHYSYHFRTTRQISLIIAFAHSAPNITIHSICAQRAKHHYPWRLRTTHQTSLFIAFPHNAPNITIHSVSAQRDKPRYS
jgi:hypothetical protein